MSRHKNIAVSPSTNTYSIVAFYNYHVSIISQLQIIMSRCLEKSYVKIFKENIEIIRRTQWKI